jgi:MFS superfamily sulfate permease-like transporter
MYVMNYMSLSLPNLLYTHCIEGWVAPSTDPVQFYQVWKFFLNPSNIYWKALPPQFLTWLMMYVVVAFGSCLDVAAIQMDMGKPLDFNHELKTVGISNLVRLVIEWDILCGFL